MGFLRSHQYYVTFKIRTALMVHLVNYLIPELLFFWLPALLIY